MNGFDFCNMYTEVIVVWVKDYDRQAMLQLKVGQTWEHKAKL